MDFLFLIGISFFTSMLTAIIGMGGGILLIASMIVSVTLGSYVGTRSRV